jgi:hypothetical protein
LEEWKKQTDFEVVQHREKAIPACLNSILGKANESVFSAVFYLKGYLKDAGWKTDPVERVLLEQLLLAHHRLSLLQAEAQAAKGAELVKVYNTAATRLMGEVRRLALAIRQYRLPPSGRSFSVVHQQNVAAGTAGQQVTYVDQSTPAEDKVSFSSRSIELEDNDHGNHAPGRFNTQTQERSPREGRADQRAEAATLDD